MTGGAQAQTPQWRMDSFTVDAALPVATEPVYGIPDPSLQPMQLLSALSKDAGPTQVASVRWQNQPGTATALSDRLCQHRGKTPAKLGLLATSPQVHRRPPLIGLRLVSGTCGGWFCVWCCR